MVVDSAGVETEVPMNEWVEVGVFAPSEGSSGSETAIYAQRHRIRSGEQRITVTVPRSPARAAIDPYHLLIDSKTDDNVQKVKAKS